MGMKGDNYCFSLNFYGLLFSFMYYFTMPLLYSIKRADSNNSLFDKRQFIYIVMQLHEGCKSNIQF